MRLDQAMVLRGLARSRSQAREAILRGAVRVDGLPARRVAQPVASQAVVTAEADPYVGRAAHKLAHALDHFALDVGHGQLAGEIARDPRVHVLEGVNARHLDARRLPYRPDLVVVDVSFISLALVLPAVLSAAERASRAVALVKPQFEVGRDAIGKGGLVRGAADVDAAVTRIASLLEDAGFLPLGRTRSPIAGGDGNVEWLVAAERA